MHFEKRKPSSVIDSVGTFIHSSGCVAGKTTSKNSALNKSTENSQCR